MNAAAEQLACLLIMGKSERPQRPRRTRRRQHARWKRHFRKLISNLSFGFLLVGCSQSLPFARSTVPDPVHALQTQADPGVRLVAYRQIGSDPSASYGAADSVATLLANGLENEGSPLARAAAARSLGQYDTPTARDALLAALADPSPIVRAEAASSLGRLGKLETVDSLGELAKTDTDLDVRLAAAQSLVRIGDSSCNVHLVDCLLDNDVVVAQTAVRGLRQNTGADLAADYDAWNQYVSSGTIPPDAPRMVDNSGSLLGKILR